jgi:predicted ABC-type ATPase
LSQKELLVVGGPNGAGKSTYAIEFLKQFPRPYHGADSIAAELAPSNPTSMQFDAGREFLRRVTEQLRRQESFVVESTLSGRSFRNLLAAAKQAGFRSTIVFVYLDSADTCVARVQERVRKGGHDVPEADIRRRFPRSFHNFWHVYRQIADEWYVIDNSTSSYRDVAFSDQRSATILDEEAAVLLQSKLADVSYDPSEYPNLSTAKRIAELRKVGIPASKVAQRESRRLGIPNVYSINGVLYWELPDGTLSRTDPLKNQLNGKDSHASPSD